MKTIKDYDSEGSAQARVMAWKAGVRMALDNPVLGVGAGHFPMSVAGKYAPEGRRLAALDDRAFHVLLGTWRVGFAGNNHLARVGLWRHTRHSGSSEIRIEVGQRPAVRGSAADVTALGFARGERSGVRSCRRVSIGRVLPTHIRLDRHHVVRACDRIVRHECRKSRSGRQEAVLVNWKQRSCRTSPSLRETGLAEALKMIGRADQQP